MVALRRRPGGVGRAGAPGARRRGAFFTDPGQAARSRASAGAPDRPPRSRWLVLLLARELLPGASLPPRTSNGCAPDTVAQALTDDHTRSAQRLRSLYVHELAHASHRSPVDQQGRPLDSRPSPASDPRAPVDTMLGVMATLAHGRSDQASGLRRPSRPRLQALAAVSGIDPILASASWPGSAAQPQPPHHQVVLAAALTVMATSARRRRAPPRQQARRSRSS